MPLDSLAVVSYGAASVVELVPTYSTIILTYRRDKQLLNTLCRLEGLVGDRDDHEIILVDNNADRVYRGNMLDGFRNATLVDRGKNLGVAGGRNEGIEVARGSVLVFLDDDAIIETEDFLEAIEDAFLDEKVGIVAFLSRIQVESGYGNGWTVDPKEFPHTDKTRNPAKPFETFRFIGVGHAIRAQVTKMTGLYLPEFFYGGEEFDLSYRAMKLGWKIAYEPTLRVRHMRDPEGRLSDYARIEQMLLNKLRIAWMHLPMPELLLCAVAWSGYALKLSHGKARIFSVWREFFAWRRRSHVERKPMQPGVMAKIRQLGGQAWK